MSLWGYDCDRECWYNLDKFKIIRLRNPLLEDGIEIIEGVYDDNSVIVLYADKDLNIALDWMNDFMNPKEDYKC